MGAGAASALALLIAGCGGGDATSSTATAPEASDLGRGDVGVLNFALTLEYLEADFYRQVADSGILPKGPALRLVRAFGRTETAHVRVLSRMVAEKRGTVVSAPASDFEPVLNRGPADILSTALALENLGAAAYLGQVGRITDPEVLATALSIHSVEARHAAAIAVLAGPDDAPPSLTGALPDGAFAKPMTRTAVLAAIRPYVA